MNADREIIRSNPDIKSALIHSPRVSIYSNNETTSTSRNNGVFLEINKRDVGNAHNTTNTNNISNLSNNMSLNLSIHTAEEFGIEMLAWLNSEGNSRINHSDNPYKLAGECDESKKLTTNATLV